jgi:hypothetical protein
MPLMWAPVPSQAFWGGGPVDLEMLIIDETKAIRAARLTARYDNRVMLQVGQAGLEQQLAG